MSDQTYYVFFTNLANPLKMDIILSLRDNKKSVNELVKDLKVEQSKVSHALACLKNCKIVNSEQKGKQRIYSLSKKTIIPMLTLLDKHARANCNCETCAKDLCLKRK